MSQEIERVREAMRDIEISISRLSSRLDEVEHLVSTLTDTPPARGTERQHRPALARDSEASGPAVEATAPELAAPSVLIGRSLIVLGGAYLLRALTESGAFPITWGATAGLFYAAIFALFAHRQAPALRASATFHGMMAIIVAMPLAVETAVRFKAMDAETAFAIILAFAGVVGAISIRNHLEALGWIVQSVTVVSLIALIIGSRSFAFGLAAFLAISIGSTFLARHLSSPAFTFLPALFSSLLVLPIADLALVERTPPGALMGMISILAYVAVWTAILMIDSREHPDRLGPGLLVHLCIVMLLGVGGSLFIAQRASLSFLFAPVAGLIALATGLYAWRMVIRAGDRDRRSVTFVTVTSLLIMALTGSLLGPQASAATWLVLSALSFLIAKSGHRLLYESVSLLILGAAFVSGLVTWIGHALFTPPDASILLPSMAAIATLGLSAVFLLAASPPTGQRVVFRWVINAVTTGILVGGCAAIAFHLLRLALPSVALSDPGTIAATRTIVLSITAISLGWLTRFQRSETMAWLVNPILILIAVLIITVNVRVGRAATHFPAFSIYGVALIAAPALRRRGLKMRSEELQPSTSDHVSRLA